MEQRAESKGAETRLYTQNGVSLIAAIFIIVILAFMGVMFVSMVNTASFTSVHDLQSTQALYVAEGGMERAIRFVDSPIFDPTNTDPDRRRACASVTGDAALTNVALGPGQFTVTADLGSPFYPAPSPVTLSSIVGATINVNGDPVAAGYGPLGRIMIDRELIDYSGITTNSFTGAVRGRDGSAVSVHTNGTPIGQYQCAVTSTGGIPTLPTPAAQRAVREGIQLQEGWAVGGGGLPTDNLNSVYCIATDDCWAVGNAGTIIHWNGVSWGEVVSPTTENLNEVHCADSNNCWAVGNAGAASDERPLFLQWDGVNWTQYDSSTLNINEDLNSVYCANNNYCWSVGTPGGTNSRQPFLLSWDGAAWTPYDSSAINQTQVMNSVSMVSTIYGWAVGTPGGTNSRQPFLLNWDGTAWTPYNSSAINLTLNLNSVAMVSTTYGWTVGDSGGTASTRPFLMSWDGTAWAPYNSSAINLDLNLNSVAMVSTTYGWTVGDSGGTANRRPFLMSWNGAAWTPYNSTALNLNVALNSVSCIANNDCWAVGDTGTILRWNGTNWSRWQQANATVLRWRDVDWADVSGVLPLPPPVLNGLNSVSMLSYADGWAVGNADATPSEVMFRWNGTAWARVGPSVTISNRNLTSIFCVSSNECYAVGVRGGWGSNERPWILEYDGAWSSVNTGNTANANLNSVYCPASGDCWAVGDRTGGGGGFELVYRLSGGVWARQANNAYIPSQNLMSVYCTSASECFVVGAAGTSSRWTSAGGWTNVSPSPGGYQLNSVFMLDTTGDGFADDGWAVGNTNGTRPTAYRWNIPCAGGAGTGAWNSCTLAAYIPAINQTLNSVYCVGTDDCWAAGNGGLIIHWDGTAWTQVQSYTVQNIKGIYFIGPRQRPQAVWQEVVN